jgi:hypothetical protein
MIEEVYRQDDEVRRDFEQWQWKREREQLKKRSGGSGLVYKTHTRASG